MHTTINTRGFFDATSNERRISHYIASTKDLVVYSLQDPENPVVVDVNHEITQTKKLSSRSLKICGRSGVIQSPEGLVFFIGGRDENSDRPHRNVRVDCLPRPTVMISREVR